MNTIDEAIAVLQAMKEGKVIEWKQGQTWEIRSPLVGLPNFFTHIYRVRPEPKKVWIVSGTTTDECRMDRHSPLMYTYTYDNKQQAESTANSFRCWPLLYVNVTIKEKELPCQ